MTMVAVLREHWETTLRETCSLLRHNEWLMKRLGLKSVPSKSTLHSAMRRIPVWWLRRVNAALIRGRRAPGRPAKLHVAIDSSGLHSTGQSAWYTLVLGRFSRREFRKIHLAVECRQSVRFVYSWTLTRGQDADSPLFPKLLRDTAHLGPIGDVCADSAYASRANAQLTQDLGGRPFIRPKINHTPKARGSPAWKMMLIEARSRPRRFKKRYGRRWIVEAVNSMFKRKWGDSLKSHVFAIQKRELGLRIILHNVRELLKKELLARHPKVSSTEHHMHRP